MICKRKKWGKEGREEIILIWVLPLINCMMLGKSKSSLSFFVIKMHFPLKIVLKIKYDSYKKPSTVLAPNVTQKLVLS